jgi:hypothetical protein
MKKTMIMTGFAAIAFTFVTVAVQQPAAAADKKTLQAPTEEMVIDGKKPARFNHQTHLALGIACGACHHDAEHHPLTAEGIAALETPEKLKCESCHNENFANAELNSKKLAFHARCKECHKKGVNGKTGPTKCTGCHIKKKVEG